MYCIIETWCVRNNNPPIISRRSTVDVQLHKPMTDTCTRAHIIAVGYSITVPAVLHRLHSKSYSTVKNSSVKKFRHQAAYHARCCKLNYKKKMTHFGPEGAFPWRVLLPLHFECPSKGRRWLLQPPSEEHRMTHKLFPNFSQTLNLGALKPLPPLPCVIILGGFTYGSMCMYMYYVSRCDGKHSE